MIGIPDPKWGERPKAFVVRKPDVDVTEDELIAYLQKHIARFKVPKAIEFIDVPPAYVDREAAEIRHARQGMGRTHQPHPGLRVPSADCGEQLSTPGKAMNEEGPPK